jgi:glycosyltransferase involved in cell wall biosynthesis
MKKIPYSVGYFSAYYRGLEYLLDMWPEIKKQVPKATLDVYYGWESWLGIQGEDEFYHKMEDKFEELKDQGVTVHGRVGHKELAKKMLKTQVWAYPTEFPEIHCITALKTQEAHCYPVVTNVAALKETVQSGDKIETLRIGDDEYKQKKFIDAVVEALNERKEGTPVPNCDWKDVAKQWTEVFNA